MQRRVKKIGIADQKLNYYFTDSWENHDGIEPDELAGLVKAVMNEETPSQMIAVHCRAGVGRTGTFLAAYAIISDIDRQIASGVEPAHLSVSIDKIMWELSLQRPFMVSHYSQYLSLYRLADWYVNSLRHDTFPNMPDQWRLPSLITPEKHLTFYQKTGQIPSCPPPKTIIFCYSKKLMNEVRQNYRLKQCDGKMGEIYFFADHPSAAIACFGWGAPYNAAKLDLLFSWGVKRCISIGSAGGLQKDLAPGQIIVCDRAIRDEGLSHHYLPLEKYAYPSKDFTDTLCQTLSEMKIDYRKGTSWTTDALYRQTREEVEQYQKEGVLTSEMEAAALFSVSSLHHAEIISFFVISDTLGDLEWKPAFDNAKTKDGMVTLVKIALEVAAK